MTASPVDGYCTLADLRSAPLLNWPATDTTQDQLMCDIITAVSRGIDQETGRKFYKDANDVTKYFTAIDPYDLFVDDIVSVTSVATDSLDAPRTYGFTWAATDYDLYPYDAQQHSEQEPYRWIRKTPRGVYTFPAVAKGVKIVGKWGWPAIPTPIQKAALLWSMRVFKRFGTTLGTAAMTAMGGATLRIPEADPDVKLLYSNYGMKGS